MTTNTELTAELIHGFSESLLKKNYDGSRPTPPFHKEMWEMCSSDDRQVAIAAPRGHAKSTAITHAFTLASAMFRKAKYIVIVSATESQSVNFLGDIKNELVENEDIRELFDVKKLVKESETDIICQFGDGEQFRILAKGSEQKLRGLKWRGRRPDLIVGDDLESDDQVLNKERRDKFRRWFFGALVPAVSSDGLIRIVGTILHFDSLLENLMTNPSWVTKKYRAHDEDYSSILWPELWNRERLEAKQEELRAMGIPEVYSQEYLNNPIDEQTAFFNRGDFRPITDFKENLVYYLGVDLAVSTAQSADFTSIAVIGVAPTGKLKVVEINKGRWDTLTIIEELFETHQRYSPELVIIERGAIEKAIGPVLYAEMNKRGIFMNLRTETPTKDKVARARGIQARMRAGAVEWNQEAYWYNTAEEEFLRFPRGKHDDVVDSVAWVGLVLDKLVEANTDQEQFEEDWENEFADEINFMGVSEYTGY